MKKASKKPTDLTTRNARASKARDAALDARLIRIEALLDKVLPGWRKLP